MRGAGVAVTERLVRHNLSTVEQAEAATQDVLADSEPPTGLFTSQNLVTIGALRTLRAAGLRDRMAHVDDVVLADLLDPGVTIVAQDPREIGHLAATMLFARIDGDRSPARTVVVQTRLIVRRAGGRPPTSRGGTRDVSGTPCRNCRGLISRGSVVPRSAMVPAIAVR